MVRAVSIRNGARREARLRLAKEQRAAQLRAQDDMAVVDLVERFQLTTARESLHMGQAELARALGVAANTVNRWEAGTRTIPPYLWLALDGLRHHQTCKS